MISRRELMELVGGAVAGRSASLRGPKPVEVGESSDRLIGAHYYVWYGPENHWDSGYTGNPVLGEYNSKNKSVIDKHATWASNFGINWLNVSWWGPDSYSGQTLERHVAPALTDTPVNFSVLYEPRGRLTYSNHQADFGKGENQETLIEDLTYIAESLTPSANYLRIDGLPVLYVYIAHSFTGDVKRAFKRAQDHADQEFYLIGDYGNNAELPNPVFDAVSPYNMYHPVEGINKGFVEYVNDQYERWDLVSKESGFTFIPIAVPGFNNTEASWAPDGQPILNRSSDRYRALCDIVRTHMDETREIALVTTFNEWHEYTSVEPGESFGTTYLEITKKNLSNAPSKTPRRDLVPLTFHWQTYVPEESVNPDGADRRLTIAVRKLRILDEKANRLKSYDIGGSEEPVLTQGVSAKEAHDGSTWRWLTANRNMVSTMYLPAEIGQQLGGIEIDCRALEDDFTFNVSVGDTSGKRSLNASKGWSIERIIWDRPRTPTSSVRQNTTSPTTSRISNTTGGDAKSGPTDRGIPNPEPSTTITHGEHTSSAIAPGFGLLSAVLGVLAGVGSYMWLNKPGNEWADLFRLSDTE